MSYALFAGVPLPAPSPLFAELDPPSKAVPPIAPPTATTASASTRPTIPKPAPGRDLLRLVISDDIPTSTARPAF
jgi:hypothetical protein